MAGNAEAARVGETVTVDEEQIGRDPELVERRQRGRGLAKRQQARHIGKRRRAVGEAPLSEFEARKRQHRNRRAGALAAVAESDVDAGNVTHGTKPVGRDDLGGERALQLARGRRGPGPAPGLPRAPAQRRRAAARRITRSVSDHRS